MDSLEQEPGEASLDTKLSPREEQPEESALQLDLHVDEDVWMKQIGHLKDWCSGTRTVHLGVPERVPTPLAADSIRLLWLFPNLQHLDITYNSTRSRIEQPILVACAELLNLATLRVCGGHLHRKGLDLGVLTSLRRLHTLSVRPHSDEGLDGLEDEHLAAAARLTGLRSLSLRASENVTDEGVAALTALTGLTQLSLVPLGLCVTREGVSALSDALPHLASLSVGLHESRQVAALKGLAERRPAPPPPAASASVAASASASAGEREVAEQQQQQQQQRQRQQPQAPVAVSVVLNSPEASASGFLSTLTLVLRPGLVGLRMATVEATDSTFLLAVGTLTALTELKMGVSLPEGGRPFTCNLAALSSLSRLHTLEFAVTKDLGLPLSVKLVSMLALSWPQLTSLSLSVMAKPEVAPEALDLLDNFGRLRSLSLFAPLDYSCDEEAEALTLPVNPRYLPRGLTHLVLESAELREPQRPRHSSPVVPSLPSAPSVGPGGQSPLQSSLSVGVGVGAGTGSAASAGAGAGGGGGGASGAGWAHGAVLPGLQHLELDSCRVSDEQLAAILGSATGLRHLELSDVRGVTAAGLAALRGLTRLESLVVRLGEHHSTAAAAANGRPAAGGGGSGGGAVGHHCLALLRNAATLRHLEWSLPQPIDSATMERVCAPVLASLGGLQELSLDVAPELRLDADGDGGGGGGAAAAARAAAAATPGRAGGATKGAEEGSGEEAEEQGLSWAERLQRALPLCTIADRPGIVVYDLWNDRMVHVVGR